MLELLDKGARGLAAGLKAGIGLGHALKMAVEGPGHVEQAGRVGVAVEVAEGLVVVPGSLLGLAGADSERLELLVFVFLGLDLVDLGLPELEQVAHLGEACLPGLDGSALLQLRLKLGLEPVALL